MDVSQFGVEGQQCLAHRQVQGVDRTVALGGSVYDLVAHLHLDRGLCGHTPIIAIAYQDMEIEQLERRFVPWLGTADE